MQYPRRRPIASPLEVCVRRPRCAPRHHHGAAIHRKPSAATRSGISNTVLGPPAVPVPLHAVEDPVAAEAAAHEIPGFAAFQIRSVSRAVGATRMHRHCRSRCDGLTFKLVSAMPRGPKMLVQIFFEPLTAHLFRPSRPQNRRERSGARGPARKGHPPQLCTAFNSLADATHTPIGNRVPATHGSASHHGRRS